MDGVYDEAQSADMSGEKKDGEAENEDKEEEDEPAELVG